MHDTDRPRFFLAIVVTLIAVPAFLLISRDSDGEPGDDTVVASDSVDDSVINPIPAASDIAAPTSNESQLPPLDAPDGDPIFMDGPVADSSGRTVAIAVPAAPAIEPVVLAATFRSTVPGTRSCIVRGISSNRTVTVRNLDNGRSITCVTIVAPASQVEDMIMHTEAFEQLADLTEAPIPVEVQQ
ncbi:MAG: hypothetical protein ACE37B_07450 [Ilumatobacter sp.]|jgi:hypothetical protein|uniref:hypothetical protein n=1 Tax=Ilumatobacter sp. TaxID=1967498 RepID=UPI00391976C4